jgi:uracil-DNA glycosylase
MAFNMNSPSLADYRSELGLGLIWQSKHRVEVAITAPVEQTAQPTPVTLAPVAVITALVPDTRQADIAQLSLSELAAHQQNCTACSLHLSRQQAMPGFGDAKASWLAIEAAPTATEDSAKQRHAGPEGQLFNNILKACGQSTQTGVYVSTLVRCSPGNRAPSSEEIQACAPYLAREIALIKPKQLIALGRAAAVGLLPPDQQAPAPTIGQLRAKKLSFAELPVTVTLAMSELLREPKEKARAWDDWSALIEV